MLVFYSILLAILLGLWAWTRRAAWSIPVAIVAVLFVATWLNFRWEVTGLLVAAIVVIALAVLFARVVIGSILAVTSLLLAAAVAFGLIGLAIPTVAVAAAAPNADTIKALTVTTATYTCQKDSNGLVAFDIGALKPVGADGRKWSDAVSTPFKETTPVKMSDELMSTICQDPEMGAMVANYFANLKLGGFEVASVNPWLNEFKGDGESVIHVKAASYIGLLNVKDPSNDQVAAAATKNKDYQAVAGKVNTLLSKFVNGGVHEDMSKTNYHLLGGGLAADSLPAVGLNNKQESLPALQFFLTQKGQEECLAKIGFNTGDKRLETFSCKKQLPVCVPGTDKAGQTIPGGETAGWCNTPKPSAPEKPTPEVPSTPSTPEVPGCTVNCAPPPPPTCPPGTVGTPPNCLESKIPSQDPGPRGNAPVGGGRNDTSGPGTYIPPQEMQRPPAVQPPPPAAPAPEPAPVGSEPAPAPLDPGPRPIAPPETGAPEPSTAPSTCIVAPGKTSC